MNITLTYEQTVAQWREIVTELGLAPVRHLDITEYLRVRPDGRRIQTSAHQVWGGPRAQLLAAAMAAKWGEGLEFIFGSRICCGDHDVRSIDAAAVEALSGPKIQPKVWPASTGAIEYEKKGQFYWIDGPQDASALVYRCTSSMGSTDEEDERCAREIERALDLGKTEGEFGSAISFRVGVARGRRVGGAKWKIRQSSAVASACSGL